MLARLASDDADLAERYQFTDMQDDQPQSPKSSGATEKKVQSALGSPNRGRSKEISTPGSGGRAKRLSSQSPAERCAARWKELNLKAFIDCVKDGKATKDDFAALTDLERKYAILAFLIDASTPLPSWFAQKVTNLRQHAQSIALVTPSDEFDKDVLSQYRLNRSCVNKVLQSSEESNDGEASSSAADSQSDSSPQPESIRRVTEGSPTIDSNGDTDVDFEVEEQRDEEHVQGGRKGKAAGGQQSTRSGTASGSSQSSQQQQHGAGSTSQSDSGGSSGGGGGKPPGKDGSGRGDELYDADSPRLTADELKAIEDDSGQRRSCAEAFRIDLSEGKTVVDAARSLYRNVAAKSSLCNTLERERGEGEAASSVRLPCDFDGHLYPLYESVPMIIGVAAGIVGSDGKARGVLVPTLALSTAPQGHCVVIAVEQGMKPPKQRELDWEKEAQDVNAEMKKERDRTIHFVRLVFAVGKDDVERATLRTIVPAVWQPLDPSAELADAVNILRKHLIVTMRKKRDNLFKALNIKDFDSAKAATEHMQQHADSYFLAAHAIRKDCELQQLRYTNNTMQLLGEHCHDSDKLAGVAAAMVDHRCSATTGTREGLARFHPTFDIELEKSGQELFYSRAEEKNVLSTSGHTDALLPMPRLLAAYNHPYANFLPAALVPATLCSDPNLFWTHALTFRDSAALRDRLKDDGRLEKTPAASWTIRIGQVFEIDDPTSNLTPSHEYLLVVATGVRFSESMYKSFDQSTQQSKQTAPESAEVLAWEKLKEFDSEKKMFLPVALVVRLPESEIRGCLDSEGFLSDEHLRQTIKDLRESTIEAINAESLASDGVLCRGVKSVRIRPPSGANLLERKFYEVDNRMGLGWVPRQVSLFQRKSFDLPSWVEDAVLEFALERPSPRPASGLPANEGWHAFYKRCYEDAMSNSKKLNSKVIELVNQLGDEPPSRLLVESQVLPVADNDHYTEGHMVTPYFVTKEGRESRAWVEEHRKREADLRQFRWGQAAIREECLANKEMYADQFDDFVKHLRSEFGAFIKAAKLPANVKGKAVLQGLLRAKDQEGESSPVRTLYKMAVETMGNSNSSTIFNFVRNVLSVFDKQAYLATVLMRDTDALRSAFSQPYPQEWRKQAPYNDVPATTHVLFDAVPKEGQPADKMRRTKLHELVSFKAPASTVSTPRHDVDTAEVDSDNVDSHADGDGIRHKTRRAKGSKSRTTSASGRKRSGRKASRRQSAMRDDGESGDDGESDEEPDDLDIEVLPPAGPRDGGGQELQYYNKNLDHERGLKYNCSQLGLEVCFVDNVIGRGVKTTLPFAAGTRVGYYWGRLVAKGFYKRMFQDDAKEQYPVERGKEDFITPIQEGIWRGVATSEGTLIGSAQCPMSFINHTVDKKQINVDFDLSDTAVDSSAGYKSFPIVAKRDIEVGELLWAHYGWSSQEWSLMRKLREKARAKTLQRTSGTRNSTTQSKSSSSSAPPLRGSNVEAERVTEDEPKAKRLKVQAIADAMRSDEVRRMIDQRVREEVAAHQARQPPPSTPAASSTGGPRRSPRNSPDPSGGSNQHQGGMSTSGLEQMRLFQEGLNKMQDVWQQQQHQLQRQMQQLAQQQQAAQQQAAEQQVEQQKQLQLFADRLATQQSELNSRSMNAATQVVPTSGTAHALPVVPTSNAATQVVPMSDIPHAVVPTSNIAGQAPTSNPGFFAPHASRQQNPFGSHMAAFHSGENQRQIMAELEWAKSTRALNRDTELRLALERDAAQRQLDQISRASHDNGFQQGFAAAQAALTRFLPNGPRSS